MVNEVLRPFGHYFRNETTNVDGGTMVREFFSGVLNTARDWLTGSDAPPLAVRKRREDEFIRERQIQERLDDRQEKEDGEDHKRTLETLLITDACRRACEQLSRDIGDAIAAVRLVYEQALRDEELAREALEQAQRGALVLPDGRRVYFTADGARLYAEDGQEITDASLIEEARRRHRDHPGATTFETRTATWTRFQETTDKVQQLATALDRLDDLQRKVRLGIATPEELQKAREEFDLVLSGLPPALRQDVERMRDERDQAPSYRSISLENEVAGLNAEFARAHTPPLPEPETPRLDPAEETNRVPAYRSLPEL